MRGFIGRGTCHTPQKLLLWTPVCNHSELMSCFVCL
jgi:hypothetical protein